MARKHRIYKNLTGQIFGRLTVIEFAYSLSNTQLWKCLCECGEIRFIPTANLRSGHTRSCGCLKIDGKHGSCAAPEYHIWVGIRTRCLTASNKAYKHYGGRGIKICERWGEFNNFFADMGQRPSPKHSVERVDNNGDYCPENCVWAVQKAQARNKRTNRYITFNGETLCLKDWSLKLKIPHSTLSKRLAKWSLEKAFTQPIAKNLKSP